MPTIQSSHPVSLNEDSTDYTHRKLVLPLKLLGYGAVAFSIISFALVSSWAQGDMPTEDDVSLIANQWMLGIPSWTDNLFAWHPVLMVWYDMI